MNIHPITSTPSLTRHAAPLGMRMKAPAIKFSGSDASSGGGFWAGFKRFFRTIGSIFNFKSKKFQQANAEAVLDSQLAEVRGKISQAKEARARIEARLTIEKRRLVEAQAKVAKEAAEAKRAVELANKQTDEAKKKLLLEHAGKEALEWKDAQKAAAAAEAGIAELAREVEVANSHYRQFEADVKELERKIAAAKDQTKMTAVRREMAQLRDDLKSISGQGVATSETAEILQEIELQAETSRALLTDGATVEQLKAQEEVRKLTADAEADAALAELLGQGSTATQEKAKDPGLAALDELTKS